MANTATVRANSGRYDWVDYAKGIAIFLVVYRHAFEGLKRSGLGVEDFMGFEYANIMFFSFRMPLFFIVSGIFLSSSLAKRSLSVFIGKKVKTILYPYFLWGALQITSQILLSNYVNSDRTGRDYLLLFYNPRGVDQFWYLYSLFNVTVLYALNKQLLRLQATHQVILGLIMYFLSAWISRNEWEIGFVNDIFHYYLFFALGDYAGRFFRNEKNTAVIGSVKWFWILLPVFLGAQLYFLLANMRHDPERYQYVEESEPALFLLIALTGCAFMLCISFMLQRRRRFALLRVIGFHSLYIYVTHVFVISFTRIVFTKVLGIDYMPLLLGTSIVLGILLPILFYRFCQARGWYFLFSLDREKKATRVPETVAESP